LEKKRGVEKFFKFGKRGGEKSSVGLLKGLESRGETRKTESVRESPQNRKLFPSPSVVRKRKSNKKRRSREGPEESTGRGTLAFAPGGPGTANVLSKGSIKISKRNLGRALWGTRTLKIRRVQGSPLEVGGRVARRGFTIAAKSGPISRLLGAERKKAGFALPREEQSKKNPQKPTPEKKTQKTQTQKTKKLPIRQGGDKDKND